MDGDQKLPDGQERNPNQEDTADDGQEDGHGIGGCSTLWRGPGDTVSKAIISAPLPPPTSGVSEMKGTPLFLRSSLSSLLDPHTAPGRQVGRQVSSNVCEVKVSIKHCVYKMCPKATHESMAKSR